MSMNKNPIPPSDETYTAFVADLLIPDCILQAGTAKTVDILLTPENYRSFVEAHPEHDLYFLGGVDPLRKMERARDEDVRKKGHFFIDLDIRAQWKKEGSEIGDGEIKELGEWLAGALAEHPFLGKWRYIVFTGNGLHVHYFGGPVDVRSTEHWREGMTRLLETFEKVTKMMPDKGCTNAARLCRLPGSFNNKDWRHVPVEILLARSGESVDMAAVEKAGERVCQVPTQNIGAAEKKWEAGLRGVAKGQRNETAASVAGRLLHDLKEDLWETSGWGGLKEWNTRNTPPMQEKELRCVFDSIAEKERKARDGVEEDDGKGRRSQADRLVEIVTAENAVLFHDQYREPHARILVSGHWETCRVKSKNFRRWCCNLFWKQEKKTPNSNALSSALNTLEGMATYEGQQIRLENRMVWHEGALWYDLSNEVWEAVRITEEGWEIVPTPPILFQRFTHQAPQMHPVRGGDIRGLLHFTRLAKEEQKLLLLVYAVSCFIPGFPHPVPILYGDQGAAKTTTAKVLRSLIDPSTVGVLSMSNTSTELAQTLSHHYCSFFDNLSSITDWASDALCRAVTGEGFSKRELYSDDDDFIYTFQRCVGMNGINIVATKPDLLDRSILLKLERIPKAERKAEQAFWEEFNAALPSILGGVLDTLSASLRLRGSIALPEVPRMADFALWGCAIAQALGATQEEFLRVYGANINEQHEEAISESAVATAVMLLMEDRNEWTGSPSSLLEAMEQVAEKEKISTKGKEWPKAPQSLTRRLKEAKTNLAEVGIQIETDRGSGGRRIITIRKAPRNTDTTVTLGTDTTLSQDCLPLEPLSQGQEVAGDDSDGTSNDLPF